MSLQQVDYGIREDGEPLPLFVRPKDDNSKQFLQRWLDNNKEWLEQKLLEHGTCVPRAWIAVMHSDLWRCYLVTGAVMFRGFDIRCAADFEAAVRRVQPELSDEYRGTSPRRLIPGTEVDRH